MTQMPHLSAMAWDEDDQLRSTTPNAGGTPQVTSYAYDVGGQRIRKTTDWQGTTVIKAQRIYVAAVEVYREYDTNGTRTLERETLHVSDGEHRSSRSPRTAPTAPTRAHSSWSATSIPTTSVRRSWNSTTTRTSSPTRSTSRSAARPTRPSTRRRETPKRYRYTGKERDEETGLYYHGARYYAPWLGRWCSTDPAALIDGTSQYAYARNNPVRNTDRSGLATVDVNKIAHNARIMAENARVGARAAMDQLKLVTSKGMEIVRKELTVDSGRVDALTARLNNDTLKGMRGLEQKSLTAWKKGGYYLTQSGELVESRVEGKIISALEQAERYSGDLTKALDRPMGVNVLFTVRGPEWVVKQVRTIAARIVGQREGTRVGGVGVISERAVKSALAKAPTSEGFEATLTGLQKGLSGLKSISPALLMGFAAQWHEDVINRENAVMLSPFPPSPKDVAFMKAGGFDYTPGPSGAPSWKANPTVEQRFTRIGGALIILLGDPMFQKNTRIDQSTELSRYLDNRMML